VSVPTSYRAVRETVLTLDHTRVVRLLKEGGWIVAGQVLSIFASLLFVKVLTQRLEPAQYGQLALALTLGTLTCQVSMSGVMPGIVRYYTIAVEKGDVRGYLKASSRAMGYGTLVTLGLGILVLVGTVLTGHADWFALIALAIIYTQISNYNTTLSSIQNAARQRATVALHGAAEPWLRMALVLLVFMSMGRNATSAVIGYTLAMLTILGSQYLFLRRLVHDENGAPHGSSIEWGSRMWAYSKPYTTFNFFTWAQASSDRWALKLFSSTQDVGLFSVVMSLGYSPVAMAMGPVTALIGPVFFQRSGDAEDSARNAGVHRMSWQLTYMCLILTLVVFVIALGTHRWIFSLLTAPQYRQVSYLLPWVLLAGGLFAASQTIGLKLQSDLNTAALLKPKIITSILGVMLNFLGAYYGGVRGIVIAAVLFSALHFAWIAKLAIRAPEGRAA
jgi:O-antigen/teichoic acid export membrane protein